MINKLWTLLLFIASLSLAGVGIVACSSGSSGTGMGMATVSISDPATCSGSTGPFAHVYVTITDVKAHVSATAAADNDAGWVDLTPNLSKQPKQIDLLGQANNQCFLATLGDAQQLQAANYQQIRLVLADNGANIANNLCKGSANCVVTSDGNVHTLALSSESKTGIKIPSGQIASGGFNIGSGQTKDLNIDFSTCESIVQEGNGQYRLKPVLHSGEVSTTSTSINGKVLDKTTGNPVNGSVLVALEQKDAAGVDRIVMSTLANPDGTFVFCPIPAGTYDVVIVGVRADGVAYQPSIVTSVANGQTTGNVNLYAATVGTQGGATFAGMVTSKNAANTGTVTDVELSALETVGTTTPLTFTIPLLPTAQQPSATLAVSTAGSASCPQGTDCVNYSMVLPAGGPYVGAYSASGVALTLSAPWATYVIDGLAFVPSSGGTANCTPSEQKTQAYALSNNFSVSAQALAFVQCQ